MAERVGQSDGVECRARDVAGAAEGRVDADQRVREGGRADRGGDDPAAEPEPEEGGPEDDEPAAVSARAAPADEHERERGRRERVAARG